MAEETRTQDDLQIVPLAEVKDQATYNRRRALQIAGKPEEEDDAEPAEEATGKEETQKEYNEKRKAFGRGAEKKIKQLIKQRTMARGEAWELRQRLARYESGEAKPGEVLAEREPDKEFSAKVQQRADRYALRYEEVAKKTADIKDLEKAAGKIRITIPMQHQLRLLDNGPEVVVHLARHPEKAEWLYGLPQAECIEQIIKLSGKVEAEAEREDLAEKIAAKIPTPTPFKPLTGGGHHGPRPLRELSQKEYKAARDRGLTKW